MIGNSIKHCPKFVIILFYLYALKQSFASPILWQQISQQGLMESINPAIQETQISAIVGQGIFTIEGDTSPQATVELTNSQGNIGKQTTQADSKGHFIFTNIILPRNPGELWLQATDKKNLTSFPLALPQPPPGIDKIENIILSPTLAQTNNKFLKNSQGFAWGYGIANSQIEINLFKAPRFSLLKPVFAQQPLKFKVNTNQNGYFQFNLPNQTLADYKIFAGNIFQDNYSPKSTILSFRVIAWWERLWQQIISLAAKLALGLLLAKILLKLKKSLRQSNFYPKNKLHSPKILLLPHPKKETAKTKTAKLTSTLLVVKQPSSPMKKK